MLSTILIATIEDVNLSRTRMHSSRMRTVRSSSHVYPSIHYVYPRMHWAEGGCVYPRMHWAGVSPQGWCLPRGVSAKGGCLPGGYIPACIGADTPPVNRMTDRCKTLPCRNYVADGNYLFYTFSTRAFTHTEIQPDIST